MSSTITALTSGGGLAMAGDTSGQLELKTNNGTTAVTIDTSQNMGVGTASPSQRLTVLSASANIASFNSSTDGYIQITQSGAAQTLLGAVGTTGFVGTSTVHDFIIRTSNTERARLDTSGNFQFNSGYGSVATGYGCRAWVNFNGTGTPAIRASGNVSSITDNGTGDYTVNFTNAMPDANYSQNISAGLFSASSDYTYTTTTGTQTTTSCRPQISAYNIGTARIDVPNICVAIFR
jgi:hypothetical protein